MSVYDEMRKLLAGIVTSDETAERLDRAVEAAEAGHDEAVLQCARLLAERDAALEDRVALPVGADGIPIRPGDVVDISPGGCFEGRRGTEVEHIELRERWLVAVSGNGGTEYYKPEHVVHADDSFGARLRALLRERGMRQSDLAKAMGAAPAVVSRWVRGAITPRFDMLQAIREALGCSWDDLMGA